MSSEGNNESAHKAVTEDELNKAKEILNASHVKNKYSWIRVSIITAVLFVIFLIPTLADMSSKDGIIWAEIMYLLIGSFTLVVIFYTVFFLLSILINKINVNKIDYTLLSDNTANLQETIEEDFFTKLIKINFKYVDKYYLQTQVQADKSFMVSIVIAVVSFIIIAIGILLMFVSPVEKESVAIVTTSAGVLSEFIAAVFFTLYNKTTLKMAEYHQKLVLTQNIALALKLSEGLPDEDKKEAQKDLINKLTENINLYLSQTSNQE